MLLQLVHPSVLLPPQHERESAHEGHLPPAGTAPKRLLGRLGEAADEGQENEFLS